MFSTNLGKLKMESQGEANLDERMEFINEVDLILDEKICIKMNVISNPNQSAA